MFREGDYPRAAGHNDRARKEALLEVGLDGSPRCRRTLSRQEEAFGRVLREAQRLRGRVLTIHSRGAAAEVVDLIEQNTTRDRVLCVLHWFSGSPAVAKQAAALGCFFSVNGQMLEHERGRALVKSLSAERLLTETDSPFTKCGSRPSAPWDDMQTAEKVAVPRSFPQAEISKTLAQNSPSARCCNCHPRALRSARLPDRRFELMRQCFDNTGAKTGVRGLAAQLLGPGSIVGDR